MESWAARLAHWQSAGVYIHPDDVRSDDDDANVSDATNSDVRMEPADPTDFGGDGDWDNDWEEHVAMAAEPFEPDW